jgi:hypothetical protein
MSPSVALSPGGKQRGRRNSLDNSQGSRSRSREVAKLPSSSLQISVGPGTNSQKSTLNRKCFWYRMCSLQHKFSNVSSKVAVRANSL